MKGTAVSYCNILGVSGDCLTPVPHCHKMAAVFPRNISSFESRIRNQVSSGNPFQSGKESLLDPSMPPWPELGHRPDSRPIAVGAEEWNQIVIRMPPGQMCYAYSQVTVLTQNWGCVSRKKGDMAAEQTGTPVPPTVFSRMGGSVMEQYH